MNMQLHSTAALEKALGQKIRDLLSEIPWLQDLRAHNNPAPFERRFDWLVEFRVPTGPDVWLWIDCKANPRPAHFPYDEERLPDEDVKLPYVCIEREFDEDHKPKRAQARVFAAPYLSPRMRELCEKHGWSWYDLAGNCRISIPGIIHLERTGNAPVHERPKPTANLGTPEAGRVIRALLALENANVTWTQRAMETHFGALPRPIPEPSLGLINKVVRHLREEAFIEEQPGGGFRLVDPLNLLWEWRDAYRFDRHARCGYFTLLKGKALRDALDRFHSHAGNSAFAAFSAADFQAPHVRQPKTWLYVEDTQMPTFEKLVEAQPVDSGENLVVLNPNDPGVFYLSSRVGDEPLASTNAVQTYVDLWHCGERGQEAAEALLEQRLKPAWKQAGYGV